MIEKRTKNIICIFVVLLLLPELILAGLGLLLPPQYSDYYMGELSVKQDMLEGSGSHRIIFLGGSSVPFSLCCDLLSEEFPEYSFIDYGMYAGLGTVAMLDLSKDHLQQGDIVIISPEQSSQTLSDYFSGEYFLQGADSDLSLICELDYSRLDDMLAAFPDYAIAKTRLFLSGKMADAGFYLRSNFNEYGDMVRKERESNIMSDGYNPSDAIFFSEDVITDDFIEEVNDYIAAAEDAGARVYYHFPPMNELALSDGTDAYTINAYYDYLDSVLDCEILGDPNKSVLDAGWFYDTNYHLNSAGAVYYTHILSEDLKVLFGDATAISFNVPTMPEFTGDITADAGLNSEDANCFTYRETEGGYIITGLSHEGLERRTLTLPGDYEDSPVIGIDAEALYFADLLQEITIQTNIGTLYDDMFTNCPALSVINLTGGPTDYTVGGRLLPRDSTTICVPSEYLSDYLLNYNWQEYSSNMISK